jgi:hypothetical protein
MCNESKPEEKPAPKKLPGVAPNKLLGWCECGLVPYWGEGARYSLSHHPGCSWWVDLLKLKPLEFKPPVPAESKSPKGIP